MGRRKDENIRKIQQSGKRGSYHINLPISFIRQLRWKEGQKVCLKLFGKGILIKDWPLKKRHKK